MTTTHSGGKARSRILMLSGMALMAAGMVSVAVAGGSRIAEEGELGAYWTLAKGSQLDVAGYPETMLDQRANACLSVGYRISLRGVPRDFVVLDRWNSVSGEAEPVDGFWRAFEASAALAVSRWRFQPLEGVEAQPTFTVSTFGFMADSAMSNGAVRSHCQARDLVAAERRAGSRRNRDLISHNPMPAQHAAAESAMRNAQTPVVMSAKP